MAFKTTSKRLFVALFLLASFGLGGVKASDSQSVTTKQEAQSTVTVRGTVVDEKGEPMIGATVKVPTHKGKGAITDVNGNFTIAGLKPDDTLEISVIGYKTQQIKVGSQTTFSIKLEPDNQLLNEVVVVGYGTQKKVNLTGAVSSVDAKALQARPVQNVAQALQGAVPGLNFSVTNSGGALDSRMSVNIRGAGTIGAGSSSSPLVLIDGVEGDMNSLSPEDIENISILKDASSSAIYGSRAAFGVILITTKSGRQGKTHFSYNGNVRFSTPVSLPKMLDSYRFAQYWNRAAANSGNQPIFDERRLDKIKRFMEGDQSEDVKYGTEWVDQKGYWGMYDNGGWGNTDWFQEHYRSNVPSHEHNVALSGGTEKINYYLSGAILNQQGLIRHGEDNFQRYNLSGKVSVQATPFLNITYNNRWVREDYDRPSYLTALFFHNIARRWPNNVAKDPNGHWMEGQEIIQLRDGGRDINQKDILSQQVTAQFDITKDWMVRLEGNYNTTTVFNHWDVLPIYQYNKEGLPEPMKWDEDNPPGSSKVSESASKRNYFNGRFFTQYAHRWGKHDFKAVAGLDMEYAKNRNLGGEKKDLITALVPTVNTATNDKPSFYGGYSHWATMGMFGRINYVFDDRYLFEFSVRRDGSSRFIGDKTWGTFPSFSAGWNIANESFFEPLRGYISYLKLRGSYGQLGNTNIDALYPWYQGLPIGGANSAWVFNKEKVNTSDAPGLVSTTLTWERVSSWNLGVDFSAFRSRLQGSFEVFNRKTYDMVGPSEPLPSILGTGVPPINNTDMISYGWETEIKWRDQVGDLTYGVKLVLSDDQQVVTKYYNPNNSLSTWYPGRKNGEIWGYTSVGIAKTNEQMTDHLQNNKPSWGDNWAAGDVMYKDLTGDGKVNQGNNTLDNHGDLTIIGSNHPRYKFGINLDLAWKGFDISCFLQGIGKRHWYDNSPYSTGANHGMWQAAGFEEHWDFFRPEGDPLGANLDAYYPRPIFVDGGKNFTTQTRYLQSAAYMRIKNLQIGYTLPKEWLKAIHAERVRIYCSADNLYTFTKMNKVFDPESLGGQRGPGKIYPLSRVISVGVNMNF